jgi:hypothetical protein
MCAWRGAAFGGAPRAGAWSSHPLGLNSTPKDALRDPRRGALPSNDEVLRLFKPWLGQKFHGAFDDGVAAAFALLGLFE